MTKSDYADLLPVNATSLERALSGPTGRLDDIPVEIDRLLRSDECPESFLPWLAWSLSVDVWDETWPVERKRDIIRDSFDLHRLKGTLEGIRRMLFYADAKLIKVCRPPEEVYWAPDDANTLDEWKARLPTLEIYPFSDPGLARGFYWDVDFFDDDADGPDQANGFFWENEAFVDFGRTAKLIKDGQEYDVSWIDGYGPFAPLGVERFSLPGLAHEKGLYWGDGYYDDAFYSLPEQDFETVSIQRSGIESIVNAGYQVTHVEPDIEPLTDSSGDGPLYYGDGFSDEDFYAQDGARLGYREVFHLYIPGTTQGDPDGYSYYDKDMRYGIEDFRAELLVDIPHIAPLDASYDDLTGFYLEQNLDHFFDALDAVNAAKAVRDQTLLDNEVMRPVRFSDRPQFGDGLKFGQYVRT